MEKLKIIVIIGMDTGTAKAELGPASAQMLHLPADGLILAT